jgi:hypothetical protein
MSFLSSLQTFSAQAAAERQTLANTTVQPYTLAGAADGSPVTVFLSAVRADREIAENGFIVLHRAQLRVLKTSTWTPVEGVEFVVSATSQRFRIESATGDSADYSSEIVCSVIRIAA